MSFLKQAGVSIIGGIAIGAIFYTVGGVANVIFPTVTATILGVVGFSTATAIGLLEASKGNEEE